MSEYYQENVVAERQQQNGKIYYRTAREIEVPYDYFEEIRKGLSHELKTGYVELKACMTFQTKVVNELESIKREIDIINSKLVQLEQTNTIIEEKDMTIDKAKPLIEKFVKDFLTTHEHVYPSDVADELHLKYELVRKVFDLLESEDKLRKKE